MYIQCLQYIHRYFHMSHRTNKVIYNSKSILHKVLVIVLFFDLSGGQGKSGTVVFSPDHCLGRCTFLLRTFQQNASRRRDATHILPIAKSMHCNQ